MSESRIPKRSRNLRICAASAHEHNRRADRLRRGRSREPVSRDLGEEKGEPVPPATAGGASGGASGGGGGPVPEQVDVVGGTDLAARHGHAWAWVPWNASEYAPFGPLCLRCSWTL